MAVFMRSDLRVRGLWGGRWELGKVTRFRTGRAMADGITREETGSIPWLTPLTLPARHITMHCSIVSLAEPGREKRASAAVPWHGNLPFCASPFRVQALSESFNSICRDNAENRRPPGTLTSAMNSEPAQLFHGLGDHFADKGST